MLTRSYLFVVLAMVLVVFGACMDTQSSAQGPGGGGPPVYTCDNQCYMRYYNYYCFGGPYVGFLDLTCLLCPGNAAYQCVNRSDGGGTCTPTGTQTLVYYYSTGTPLCTCTPGATMAVEMSSTTNWDTVDYIFISKCI
jgi:hypothetical protein